MLPRIMGKIPNEGGVLFGFHVVPIRKSNIPILVIAGIPFINRNKHISATARIDVLAATKILSSLYFLYILT